jgi:hypothetical protein
VPVFTPESTRAVLQTPQQAVPILSPEAVALFLTIYGPQMGTPDDAHTTFLRAHVSGPQWAAFTESDYVDLGFSKGQVFTSHALFQAYQARFSEAGEFDPTLESGLRLGPVKVYPQVGRGRRGRDLGASLLHACMLSFGVGVGRRDMGKKVESGLRMGPVKVYPQVGRGRRGRDLRRESITCVHAVVLCGS